MGHRLENIRCVLRAMSAAFPGLPPFPELAAPEPYQVVVGASPGATRKAKRADAAAAISGTSSGPEPESALPDGAAGGGYGWLTAEAVAGGGDRAATMELLWRLFLGHALTTLPPTIGGPEGSPDSGVASRAALPRYLKEAYTVEAGDTVGHRLPQSTV